LLYIVDGIESRNLMVSQSWGARVLQSGNELPDSDARASWTFTVFPGEEQIEGSAPSGTILFGRVRFRLGRSDRGISVVRVCPAIVIDRGRTGSGISIADGSAAGKDRHPTWPTAWPQLHRYTADMHKLRR